MNLCSFGWHDWEVLETHCTGLEFLRRRICLRCGKKEDEIEEYIDRCSAKEKLAADRQTKAREMWINE